MEIRNFIKHNYKTNSKGYAIIWLLLLIPITFCSIQTIRLYNWSRHYNLKNIIDKMDIPCDCPAFVGDLFTAIFLFMFLSVVIMTLVIYLSLKNNKDFKYRVLYAVLSSLLYWVILYVIVLWFNNVTLLIHPGSAASTERIASNSLPAFYIIYSVLMGIYLGICVMFYRIISWVRNKGHKLFTILSILIILPIWYLMSGIFLSIFIWSML